MPNSNLTCPRIDWNWVAKGMVTGWRFEGQGSKKARTMDAIWERDRTFLTQVKES